MSVYDGHKKKFELLKSQKSDDRAFLDFVHAAEMGHINIVKAYVDVFGVDRINDKRASSAGQSAFYLAVTFQHENVSRYLLQNGADLNTQDDHGFTPFLCLAVRDHAGHPDCKGTLFFLLDAGADPDIPNKSGQRAIDFLNSDDPLWAYVMNPKARRESRLGLRRALFSKICENGELAKVKKYLEKYPDDIHHRWHDQKTCLSYALTGKAYDMIEFLVASGADVNAMDATGSTILMTAIMKKDDKAVPVLLTCGANIALLGAHGTSAGGILKQELLMTHGEEHKIFKKIKGMLDQKRRQDFEKAANDSVDKGVQKEIALKRARFKKPHRGSKS